MKKLLLCAVLLLSVLATVACDASILQIEDTNGAENAALETLTDAELLDTMPQVVKQGGCAFRSKGRLPLPRQENVRGGGTLHL